MTSPSLKLGHPLGVHRVLDLVPVLPQAAQKLDVSLPLYENEMQIDVTQLQIDSASFKQLSDQYPNDNDLMAAVKKIIDQRGKMQNPVTGSGGVLVGRVSQIGGQSSHRLNYKLQDQIVTLISLTSTPLYCSQILSVNRQAHTIDVKGYAILFDVSLLCPLPSDMPLAVALAVLDICGAPLLVKNSLQNHKKVMVLGLGKAGKSVLAMLEQEFKGKIEVFGLDPSLDAVSFCQKYFTGTFSVADATHPLEVERWVLSVTQNSKMDYVINTANVPHTEMSSILSVRQEGEVLFFGMATDFQRATLGAEAVGQDVRLRMGTGFSVGHAAYMLDLVRGSKALQALFGL